MQLRWRTASMPPRFARVRSCAGAMGFAQLCPSAAVALGLLALVQLKVGTGYQLGWL